MPTLMYDVTFYRNDESRKLHLFTREKRVAVVRGMEDSDTFRAYHLHNGKHYVPDYAAIRAALPHYYRAAFDRAKNRFWYSMTLARELNHVIYRDNACNVQLYTTRGKLIGTVYATPYLL